MTKPLSFLRADLLATLIAVPFGAMAREATAQEPDAVAGAILNAVKTASAD